MLLASLLLRPSYSAATRLEPIPSSWLVVATTRKGDLVYEAGWRHRIGDGVSKTMKRRIGPAWLGRSEIGFIRRRGRVKPGFFDEHAAIVAKDKLVREVEEALARQESEATLARNAPTTFRKIAGAYLSWLARVKGAKPATLRDHRYLLAEPGDAYRRGRGAHRGVIMAALGDRPAIAVTTREINQLLDQLADGGASARTVNKHRQLICAIYNYASSMATFELNANPASGSDRRPEPERARLDYYSPAEVEQLARALEDGQIRIPRPRPSTPRRLQSGARRIGRTPTWCASPLIRAFVAANSWPSAGATSNSTSARSSSGGLSAQMRKQRQPGLVGLARFRSPIRLESRCDAYGGGKTSSTRTI